MTVNVLFAAPAALWPDYRELLPRAIAAKGVTAEIGRDFAPGEVDYLVHVPGGPVADFRPYTRAKAVLSLWAGVEDVMANPTLTQPLTRMVDKDLTEGMVQWVLGHVLRHHLGTDAHVVNPAHDWRPTLPPLMRERVVGVLGLGQLGTAVAEALVRVGFQVAGWSRRTRTLPGVLCRSGEDGLAEVLGRSEIAVLMLPLTPGTDRLMDGRRLAMLPRGAFLINPGRGALIDDAALIAALDAGRLGHATLDTFRVEPLPQGHPFWSHPKVTVTPHVAAETRPVGACEVIAENIRRGEAGEPFLFLVDRSAGY